MGSELLDRPNLQASYQEWMRQVQAVDQALALVSEEGLRWYLSGDPQWLAHRIEYYDSNRAVSFSARGHVRLVSVDLLGGQPALELITLSSLPREVRWAVCHPRPPKSLQELLQRMCQMHPFLCEVLP